MEKFAKVMVFMVMTMLHPFQKLCTLLCRWTGKRNTLFTRIAVELTCLVMVVEITRHVVNGLNGSTTFDSVVTFVMLLLQRPFAMRRIEKMDRWLDDPEGLPPITPADAYTYVFWTFMYGLMGILWIPMLWADGDPFFFRCLGIVMSIAFLLAPHGGGKKKRALVPLFQGV